MEDTNESRWEKYCYYPTNGAIHKMLEELNVLCIANNDETEWTWYCRKRCDKITEEEVASRFTNLIRL